MAKITSGGAYQKAATTKRPNIHAKTQSSKSKKSQLKFAKRLKNNYIILDKLTNK